MLYLHITPRAFYYKQTVDDANFPIGTDGMSLYICDECTSLAANLKNFFAANNELCVKAQVLLEAVRYTLVPLSLYNDKQREEWFAASIERKDEDTILFNAMPQCDMACVFAADRFVLARIKDVLPEAQVFNQTTVHAEHFAALNKTEGRTEIYAVMSGNEIHAYAFRRGTLLTVASFHCLSSDDAVYFLLSIFKQTDLDERIHSLTLFGTSLIIDEVREKVKRFIKYVS